MMYETWDEQFEFYDQGPDGDPHPYIVAKECGLYIEDRGDSYLLHAYNSRGPFLDDDFPKDGLGKFAVVIGGWFHEAKAQFDDGGLSTKGYLEGRDFAYYAKGEEFCRPDTREHCNCEGRDPFGVAWPAISTGGVELLFQDCGERIYMYISDPKRKPLWEGSFTTSELGDFGKKMLEFIASVKDEKDEYFKDEEEETMSSDKQYMAHIRYERPPPHEHVYLVQATSAKDVGRKVVEKYNPTEDFYMKIVAMPVPVQTLSGAYLQLDEELDKKE